MRYFTCSAILVLFVLLPVGVLAIRRGAAQKHGKLSVVVDSHSQAGPQGTRGNQSNPSDVNQSVAVESQSFRPMIHELLDTVAISNSTFTGYICFCQGERFNFRLKSANEMKQITVLPPPYMIKETILLDKINAANRFDMINHSFALPPLKEVAEVPQCNREEVAKVPKCNIKIFDICHRLQDSRPALSRSTKQKKKVEARFDLVALNEDERVIQTEATITEAPDQDDPKLFTVTRLMDLEEFKRMVMTGNADGQSLFMNECFNQQLYQNESWRYEDGLEGKAFNSRYVNAVQEQVGNNEGAKKISIKKTMEAWHNAPSKWTDGATTYNQGNKEIHIQGKRPRMLVEGKVPDTRFDFMFTGLSVTFNVYKDFIRRGKAETLCPFPILIMSGAPIELPILRVENVKEMMPDDFAQLHQLLIREGLLIGSDCSNVEYSDEDSDEIGN